MCEVSSMSIQRLIKNVHPTNLGKKTLGAVPQKLLYGGFPLTQISTRQNFDSTICDKMDLTTHFHFLTSLVGTRVFVYFTTPLMNFSFKSDDIKTLSKEFAAGVDKFKSKAKGKIRTRDQPYGSCLEFTVNFGGKTVHNSYLFSIFENGAKPVECLTQLPFMCIACSGQATMAKHVKNFIEKRFHCVVENCRLTDTQMQWLLGISLKETLKRGSNDGVTLEFVLPRPNDATLRVKWTAQSLRHVWDACSANETENVISLKCIVKFVLALNEHHSNTYGLDLSTFNLKRLSLLDVNISQDDTLKVLANHTEILCAILCFLHVECVQPNPYWWPS